MTIPRIVPTVPGDELRISATAFMSFRQCPQRANARFQGHYGESSLVSFIGSLAHSIFKRHLLSGPIDSEEFVSVCRQEMGKSKKLGNTSAELGLKPSDLAGVFEQVRGLYDRFVTLPQDGFEGAEIMLEVDAATGLTLIGQIDAVFGPDDAARLVDWKTGALGEAEGQLMFYALLWTMGRKYLPSSVEAVSVTTGERFSAEPSSPSVGAIAAEVGGMVDDLRRSWSTGVDLERRGGPWCEYCPILTDCSEGQATMAVLGD